MSLPLNLFVLKVHRQVMRTFVDVKYRIPLMRLSGARFNQSRLLHTTQYFKRKLQDDIAILPTPQEVTFILRENEFNKEFTSGPVKSYDSNQLASNSPIEDTRSEARLLLTSGLLFGVFDGHGGPACAQVVSKRLFDYVAAALLPREKLLDHIAQGAKEPLMEHFNSRVQVVSDLKAIYDESFKTYLKDLSTEPDTKDIKAALEYAVLRLDDDISAEALRPLEASGEVNPKTLAVALSGAVACLAHVDGRRLHVASVGDCSAVVGALTDDNEWLAKKITSEHNADNADEVRRILSEHPAGEARTAIRRDRLLGELAPLRSLGDCRYKWPAATLRRAAAALGERALPQHYLTPPYLSARPDVHRLRLAPRDRFLILASDGLWDALTPLQAVKLVGEHMQGKVFLNPLKLPREAVTLGGVGELLRLRRAGARRWPADRNAATHLVRHALGGAECGVDAARLARLLALAPAVARMFRDDITVLVVYFDEEAIRQCPQ